MKFVTKRMVLAIHAIAVKLTGGAKHANPIREGQSLGFIEKIHGNEIFGQLIYPDLFHQAAAYLFHIIKGHVFHDGNKRAALATAVTFLAWNGQHFHDFKEDEVYRFVVGVAGGSNDPDRAIPAIAEWLKGLCAAKPSPLPK